MIARRGLAILACMGLALAPACRSCGGGSGGEVSIPPDLRIPVLIDGVEGTPIDAALLGRASPDYVDGERRAYRLTSLLGAIAGRPGVAIEIEDDAGLRTAVASAAANREPGAAGDREPVLTVNRTGEVGLALIRPEEPFPAFHGRGGNRGRSGDPTRIREVRRIWIHLGGAPGAGAPAAAPK